MLLKPDKQYLIGLSVTQLESQIASNIEKSKKGVSITKANTLGEVKTRILRGGAALYYLGQRFYKDELKKRIGK